ncbi:hypothetical protein DPMN_072507 [Dreissena polymorpha]|uniref:Uncharacterized protein n=1 Tax=Dreissena polymorpha TaxID=45954 RepID=A0A9D3Z8M7_DREPO|nr:hypothetical protein DPMN_072507 [Dreissena polymorpha]
MGADQKETTGHAESKLPAPGINHENTSAPGTSAQSCEQGRVMNVLIVESSIIRDAYHRAAYRADGTDLGLQAFGINITWDLKAG